jgi:hypothetical protein
MSHSGRRTDLGYHAAPLPVTIHLLCDPQGLFILERGSSRMFSTVQNQTLAVLEDREPVRTSSAGISTSLIRLGLKTLKQNVGD